MLSRDAGRVAHPRAQQRHTEQPGAQLRAMRAAGQPDEEHAREQSAPHGQE